MFVSGFFYLISRFLDVSILSPLIFNRTNMSQENTHVKNNKINKKGLYYLKQYCVSIL